MYTVTPPVPIALNYLYESYGPVDDRVSISRKLNQLLVDSQRPGIVVLNVYDKYADSKGVLIPELSDGSVHINHVHNQPLKKEIFKVLQRK